MSSRKQKQRGHFLTKYIKQKLIGETDKSTIMIDNSPLSNQKNKEGKY